jgi:hypothetical protein
VTVDTAKVQSSAPAEPQYNVLYRLASQDVAGFAGKRLALEIMDREQFINAQVAFQLGTLKAEPGVEPSEWVRQAADRRDSLTYFNPGDNSFIPEALGREVKLRRDNTWRRLDRNAHPGVKPIRALRTAAFLTDAFAAGVSEPVVVDMQDAVRRPNPFPCFQYVRKNNDINAILWPHNRVHSIGGDDFTRLPDPSESKLVDKKPVVFWRGALRGFSKFGGESNNIRLVIKHFRDGKIDRETLLAHLATVPRYRFVARYFGKPGFDVGIHQPPELSHYLEIPEIARLQAPYVGADAQAAARYLLSIQGTDVATTFGWQIATNSTLLKEEYSWEVYFDCHFRAWEHFVPVATDFADVEDKVAWCEANPGSCDAMIERRHALIPLLLDQDLRTTALQRLITRYAGFYAHWRSARHL